MSNRAALRNEQGIISIMVTMAMIVIVSLIVLAFAQVARREQRQALDNQLSTQAFYAAESGINQVRYDVNNGIIPATDSSCTGSNDNKILSAADNVSTTCVMINATPTSQTATNNPGTTDIFKLRGSTAFNPAVPISIHWQPFDSSKNIANCPSAVGDGTFKKSNDWNCPFSVLRLDLVKTDAPGFLSRDYLASNTRSFFVVPNSGSVATAYDFSSLSGGNSRVLASSCTMAAGCVINIKGLSGSEYYLNVQTIYGQSTQVSVDRADTTPWIGSQVQVDATGKAQDVLRRVRISFSLLNSDEHDGVAALSVGNSVCKRPFITKPGATYEYDSGGCLEP